MREGCKILSLGDLLTFDKRFNGIPKEWQSSVAVFHHVSAEKLKSLCVENGDVKLISTGLFDGFTTEELAQDCLNEGEIITIPSGGVANIKYYNGRFVDSGNLIAVAKHKDVYLKYVFYGMSFKRDVINSYFRGVSIKHPHMPDIWKLSIPVPAISEQIKIVAELDCLSLIADKKELQLRELDKLSHSIFYEMFGDPIANQRGWEKHLFREFGEVIGGYAFQSESFTSAGVPVLKIGNINSGSLKTKDLCFYPETVSLERFVIRPNDIVMSLTGTTGKDDYGNVCIIPNTYSKYYLNQRNAKLQANGVWNNIFLKFYFAYPEVKKSLTGVSRGVRQANILNKDILDLPIILPDIEIQNQFAAKIEAIEAKKAMIAISIKDINKLLHSRQEYYFSD